MEDGSSDRSPNVMLEAMTARRVVIVTYANGILTIIGDAAMLVKLSNPFH